MGRYSKAFSIKKQFQSPNCQSCQGQSRTLKKIVFLELLLRIIEEEKWNLFEKLGQLRTPTVQWQRWGRLRPRCSTPSPAATSSTPRTRPTWTRRPCSSAGTSGEQTPGGESCHLACSNDSRGGVWKCTCFFGSNSLIICNNFFWFVAKCSRGSEANYV